MMRLTTDLSFFRQKIRKMIRRRRQGISYEKQLQFANKASMQARSWLPLSKARNIALFLPFDGELDTQPLIKYLWYKGKNIYLPVIHPFVPNSLLFLNYKMHTDLVINCFKIKEPKLNVHNVIPLSSLDVLILPLVAFNKYGHRLGMGGGFYDHVMKNWRKHNFQPAGYAYDFQLVNALFSEEWDVSLPTVITPSKLWFF